KGQRPWSPHRFPHRAIRLDLRSPAPRAFRAIGSPDLALLQFQPASRRIRRDRQKKRLRLG
ncbi:MAG: hypothetical protein AB7V13_09455, partial [Pseudorhodoplanes sp.]